MFRPVYIVAFLVLWLSSCGPKPSIDPLTDTKSPADLQEDFDIFEGILRKAHPSIYSYAGPKRYMELFDSLRNTINYSTTQRDFYNKLFTYTNEIGCAHTMVMLPRKAADTLYNRALFFPEPVVLIGDRLLVNSDEGLPHGTEILSVNGVSVKNILSRLAFYNAVDGRNPEAQRKMAAGDFGYEYYTWYGGSSPFRVQIRDTLGRRKDTNLLPVNLEVLRARENGAYYFDAVDVPYSLHLDEENRVAVLRLTTFHYESDNQQNAYEDFLKNSFALLKRTPSIQSLVIDLRENRGGYLYSSFLLLSYLAMNKFSEYGSVSTRIRDIPYRSYLSGDYSTDYIEQLNEKLEKDFRHEGLTNRYQDSLIQVWTPQPDHFSGRVFIVTNANVMSAASGFAAMVQHSGRGQIIGVGTAGGSYSGNGFQTLEYVLPHTGMSFVFPYAKITYPFTHTRQECGLIPDHIVPDNEEAFRKNRDAQLRYILDSLMKKNN